MTTAPTTPLLSGKSWDDLDDLSTATVAPTSAPRRGLPADRYAKTDVASGLSLGAGRSVATVARFPCPACRGSGTWISPRGFSSGKCHKCKGVGKLKTDPQALHKRRMAKHKREADAAGAWAVAHTDVLQWLGRNVNNAFAQSLLRDLSAHGSLTTNQVEAIRRKAVVAAQVVPSAQLDDRGVLKLVDAFERARSSGLIRLKLRCGDYSFSPAKATSTNPGCIYVKADGEYLGKVTREAGFHKSGDCTPEQLQAIIAICRDPLKAAILHGKQTGHCSCCGLLLTNAESVELGIGPICRGKWGL